MNQLSARENNGSKKAGSVLIVNDNRAFEVNGDYRHVIIY